MTTPGGAANTGGLIGNLLGGAAGSLGGTNNLQQSIDTLTNAVNTLRGTISSTNFGGTGTLGTATRQQVPATTRAFPAVVNPFQPNQQQQGIGGGGPGGTGNVSAPQPFGRSGIATAASAIVSFGQQQMQPLVMLNQMATTAMLGTNNAGRQGQTLQQFYSQAGLTTNRMNFLASGVTDAAGQNAILQQLSGQFGYSGSALGSAGITASAAFGLTNPTLGATTSAQLAAALYSPQFSQNMMAMGYQPIRSMRPGGAPLNAGQAAQSILRGLGLNNMNPANLYGNLMSGRGQASLSALFGSSGISNQQAASFLEGYNQLFSKGLNANQANALFSQAAMGNTSQAKAAQARLNKLGVSTSANDLQALKDSQAVVSGRAGMYSGGFNNAIQDSTGLLEQFNSVLSSILQNTGLGGALGFGGGFGGVLSGTNHAIGSIGTIGGVMALSKLLRGGGGAAAAGGESLFAGAGGAAGGGALAGIAGAAIPIVAGLLVGAAIKGLGDKLSPAGTESGFRTKEMNKFNPSMSVANPYLSHINFPNWMANIGGAIGNAAGSIGRLFGGASGAPQPQTTQKRSGGGNQLGGVSGASKAAVGAAESQVGVPYLWGGEQPGVGFDCSGLIQWAYKQAGINLPRTSQQMWSALSKKRIALNQVQEGDLVFQSGSDGTPTSPGHVGMMVNGRQLIQAPYTGANVQIVGYNPNQWMFAARPSGKGAFTSGTSSNLSSGNSASPGLLGNRGLSIGPGTNQYGSANEVDLISAMGTAGGVGLGPTGMGNSSGIGGSGSGNKNTSATTPKNVAGVVAMARQLAQAYGWSTGLQWTDFVNIVNAESGWNVHAQNPQSDAYGIPQALPGSKMASAGKDWQSNPATQLKWMMGYIKQRYGSPQQAWQFHLANGWYGAGGTTRPGWSVVGDRGPELMYTGGGNQVFSNAQTMQLINAIKTQPAQSPWKTNIMDSPSAPSSGKSINITFAANSIVVHAGNSSSSIASKAGREIVREIVKQLDDEAVHLAIRSGDKL